MIAGELHSLLADMKKWKQPFLMETHTWNLRKNNSKEASSVISMYLSNRSISIEKYSLIFTNLRNEWQDDAIAAFENLKT